MTVGWRRSADEPLVGRLAGLRLAEFGAARTTQTQAPVLGTPGFSAAEARDAPLPASDLYSVGATLWALLVGAAPLTFGLL